MRQEVPKNGAPEAMDVMADQGDPPKPDAALDELVTRLLECGAVLSQIVGHMVQFEASGRSAPGAAPIPTVAHSLIRSVIAEPTEAHSAAEIGSAALIIKAVRRSPKRSSSLTLRCFRVPDALLGPQQADASVDVDAAERFHFRVGQAYGRLMSPGCAVGVARLLHW